MSSSNVDNTDSINETTKPLPFVEQYGFSLDELYNMARHFLQGRFIFKNFTINYFCFYRERRKQGHSAKIR